MKKIVFLVLPFVVIIFASQKILISPCDKEIHYRIDTVDDKFKLTRDKFLADTQKAADIWNKAYGKELFVYDPKGALSVNLIYDTRQLLNSQITNLEEQLNNEKSSLDPQIAQYKKDLENFKSSLADLNNQIDMWNKKGGAPEDVYNGLIQKQKDLQVEADRLNALSKSLNLSTTDFNVQVGKLNQTVDTFNTAIGQRPEEGIYIGTNNRIEIYFNITQNELIHTLAHEFGHARGLGHTMVPASIMYSKSNETITPASADLNELNIVCAQKSIFDIVITEVKNRFNLLE